MTTDTVTAVLFTGTTDSQGFPAAAAWELAPALRFDADWQGKNPDALRETEVRLLWTPEMLYLRFRARYRAITVFPDSEANGRRDHLWDRDVAEAFLQPDSSELRRYKEFEISPNGFWIDLDIAPGENRDLQSRLNRRVRIDENTKLWIAELSIPMKSLVERFDPAATWRVNFYRVEGAAEPRFYSAWRPTHTPEPNFHVPEVFGRMIFVESPVSRTPKNAALP
jgi:alpha-galactosidase